jgi:hypothetical protein
MLQSLQLWGCNSMASLPHWLGELTSLKELALLDCAVLGSLPESIQQLTGLQRLKISNCPELNQLGERVCLLPSSLEILQIWDCNGIKSLPEGMEQLTNLRRLVIYGCRDLRQWCELEENMMKLAHIKEKVRVLHKLALCSTNLILFLPTLSPFSYIRIYSVFHFLRRVLSCRNVYIFIYFALQFSLC